MRLNRRPVGPRLAAWGLSALVWGHVTAPAAAAPQPPAAAPVQLVTEVEAQREAAAGPAPVLPTPSRSLPVPASGPVPPRQTPGIEVLAPAADGRAVRSPLRLQVVFLPPVDARIVPGSFRILYGLLKLDVTERLQPHARLSEGGVVVEQAQVPQGTHRLFVRVADEKGRIAEQAVVIRVGAPR